MSHLQVARSSPRPELGYMAIFGLLSLIDSAVRACNDDLVTKLDRILQDVDALVENQAVQMSDFISGSTNPLRQYDFRIPKPRV